MIGMGIYTIPGFLTPGECARHIAATENAGYTPATIDTAGGSAHVTRVRNNDRLVQDDPALAAALWTRAQPCLPPQQMGRRLVGLNPRLRCYRYEPGQRFRWHVDGAYTNALGRTSIMTFMVYLNDGFEGGETRFHWTSVKPQAGMALVFNHGHSHEGAEVIKGTKYVLRTDVMAA